jgi:DNA-binding PadR family transcriptional regulator
VPACAHYASERRAIPEGGWHTTESQIPRLSTARVRDAARQQPRSRSIPARLPGGGQARAWQLSVPASVAHGLSLRGPQQESSRVGARDGALTTRLCLGMHKTLHLLGLLLNGPKSGYDLHRILRAHGELFADLKKANVYYLLDRLAKDGYLTVEAEPGARGPRRERLVYSITDQGRAHFEELLREVLGTPEPTFSSVAAAVIFLDRLPSDAAIALLEQRRVATQERRAQLVTVGEQPHSGLLAAVAVDHLVSLIDADLAWTDRALEAIEMRSRT